jgi:DNA-binding IclR family transcriptional regulator
MPAAQVRALYPGRDAFVQRDGRGPTSLVALRRELLATRSRGYALEDGLVTPGLASVAAAVRDHNEYPVAAVAVTYPFGEAAGDRPAGHAAAVVGAVRTSAEQISRRIHGRG